MKEVFAAAESNADANFEAIESSGTEFSIAAGEYQDPHPNMVEWINKRFIDPHENIQAVVLKAFEIAKIVKTEKAIKQLAKPLEHTGLLPIEGQEQELPVYVEDQDEPSEFIGRREEQLFLEFQEGNDTRNKVLLEAREMTDQRFKLNAGEVSQIRAYGRKYIKENQKVPPVQRVIAVMVGLSRPENPENEILSEVPPTTNEMATDVYWMMLRQESEANHI